MAEGIFSRIENTYPKFTKSEKIVADFVFDSPEKVLYTSITDLAEICGVGDTTVFRFCKALKLNGYQEFKMYLAQDLAVKTGSDYTITGSIRQDDDIQTICKKALTVDIAALTETFEGLDFNAVQKVVDLIASASKIQFFGMGSSGVIAQEAKMKFMRILPNVEYIADCHMQYMSAALLTGSDLAVIFSYSGSTKDTIEIANLAKENGCKIVCITRYINSHLASISDVVLVCGSNEGPLEGGASSTTMVQLYILDILYLQYFTKHYHQCKVNKSKTTESISSKVL